MSGPIPLLPHILSWHYDTIFVCMWSKMLTNLQQASTLHSDATV